MHRPLSITLYSAWHRGSGQSFLIEMNRQIDNIYMNNRTQTTQVTAQSEAAKQEKAEKSQRVLILNLKSKPAHRVSWTQDTVDNEGMNKKKSNLCCIYHRPGEESSDTCSSDDDGNALERDRHTKHLHKQKCSKLNKKKEEAKQQGKESQGKQ